MTYDTFQVAVKAVCFDKDKKLLLLKDFKGEWDMPGGRVNYGENLAEALIRECKEELGVLGRIVSTKPDYAWLGQNTDGAWRVDICYAVDFTNQKFQMTDENVEHGYFGKQEIAGLNLSSHLNGLKEIF